MKLTKPLVDYIEFINLPYSINSDLIITDLERVIYNSKLINLYKGKKITDSIINIINQLENEQADDVFIIKNENCYKIINEDPIEYSSQIFLPILSKRNSKNEIIGLGIFFRTRGNYINSSVKPLRTIRNFIEQILDNN